MRISDWSSDVCSSDLRPAGAGGRCAIGEALWFLHRTHSFQLLCAYIMRIIYSNICPRRNVSFPIRNGPVDARSPSSGLLRGKLLAMTHDGGDRHQFQAARPHPGRPLRQRGHGPVVGVADTEGVTALAGAPRPACERAEER